MGWGDKYIGTHLYLAYRVIGLITAFLILRLFFKASLAFLSNTLIICEY